MKVDVQAKNWRQKLKRYQLPLMLGDLLGVHVAFAACVLLMKYLIGEDFGAVLTTKNYLQHLLWFSALVWVCHAALGLYRRRERTLNVGDLIRILVATVSSFGAYCLLRKYAFQQPIRLYFVCLQAFTSFLIYTATRFFYMAWARWIPQMNAGHAIHAKRTLIVGAGHLGQSLAASLMTDPAQRGLPVVFVDDDPLKKGLKYQGLKVAGNRHDLPKLVQNYAIDRILLAIPYIEPEDLQEILSLCSQTDCEVLKTDLGNQWPQETFTLPSRQAEFAATERKLMAQAMRFNYPKLPLQFVGSYKLSDLDSGRSLEHLPDLENLLKRAVEGVSKQDRPLDQAELANDGKVTLRPAQRDPHLTPLTWSERLNRPRLPALTGVAPWYAGLRLTLIGCGMLGQELIKQLVSLPLARLDLIDQSPQALAQANALLDQVPYPVYLHCYSVGADQVLPNSPGYQTDWLLVGLDALGLRGQERVWGDPWGHQAIEALLSDLTQTASQTQALIISPWRPSQATTSEEARRLKQSYTQAVRAGAKVIWLEVGDLLAPVQEMGLSSAIPPAQYDLTAREAAQLILLSQPHMKSGHDYRLKWASPILSTVCDGHPDALSAFAPSSSSEPTAKPQAQAAAAILSQLNHQAQAQTQHAQLDEAARAKPLKAPHWNPTGQPGLYEASDTPDEENP